MHLRNCNPACSLQPLRDLYPADFFSLLADIRQKTVFACNNRLSRTLSRIRTKANTASAAKDARMVATTNTQIPAYSLENPEDFVLARSADYCVAWRIRGNSTWHRQYFANRFEAHRRYLDLMTRASELCLYVPTENT